MTLRCLIRRQEITDLPEERVRQRLISLMINELGYPSSSISVEVSLNSLPHTANQACALPNRRADLICFAKDIHQEYKLFPLLMVECKAKKVSEAAWEQVRGYNLHIGAPFVAIASPEGVEIMYHLSNKRGSFLPSYQSLLDQVLLDK